MAWQLNRGPCLTLDQFTCTDMDVWVQCWRWWRHFTKCDRCYLKSANDRDRVTLSTEDCLPFLWRDVAMWWWRRINISSPSALRTSHLPWSADRQACSKLKGGPGNSPRPDKYSITGNNIIIPSVSANNNNQQYNSWWMVVGSFEF